MKNVEHNIYKYGRHEILMAHSVIYNNDVYKKILYILSHIFVNLSFTDK